jgi:hypothetical protein
VVTGRDPLARPPTHLRLWAAAALAVVPLGLTWTQSAGTFTLGTTIYGDCGYAGDDYVCNPDVYVPGTYFPGSHVLGAGSPARVFLVFAAVVLAWAAARPRTPRSRRWVRLATIAAAFALALALGARAVPTAVCLTAALALAGPPAWRRPRPVPVFGNAPVDR